MNTRVDVQQASEMIGLIPAAGRATRIWPLPCSKEIYPIGLGPHREVGGLRPKVTCQYLLEKMRRSGIKKAFIILRPEKWDIPAYCSDGTFVDMRLAYLTVRDTSGPPFTLDQAFPFVQHAAVAFGFPDILFRPYNVFIELKNKLETANCAVVLGLFPAEDHRTMDMVEVDARGAVTRMYLKPHRSRLKYAWICAVWSPPFTRFLHDYVASFVGPQEVRESPSVGPLAKELTVGHVLQAAVRQGLNVQTIIFKRGRYVDIGTPTGLRKAALYL